MKAALSGAAFFVPSLGLSSGTSQIQGRLSGLLKIPFEPVRVDAHDRRDVL
jgi:hypothetical protein